MTDVKGTYAAVWPDYPSQARLESYFKKHVNGLVDDFHITTTYSRVILPNLKNRTVVITVRPATFRYEMFGPNNEYLVLAMSHPTLTALWKEAMQLGATWDHREYAPHVTLSSTFKGKISDLPPLPQFKLRFDRYKVEELKD